MSIITISRGVYSLGQEVAEKLAEKLGYECISREILLEASEHFHIPEIKLERAIHDAPSILDRLTYGKERYISYIKEAILEHLKKDNVVYHGLAGHFFLPNIDHVLKVRITSDLEKRVKEEMERNNIPEEDARKLILKDDHERRQWSEKLYGIDTWDSSLYDIVLHMGIIGIDEAVHIIKTTLDLPCFETTPESQKALDDLFLAAHVQAHIVEKLPSVKVSAKDGIVVVNIEAPLRAEDKISEQIHKIADNIAGVKEIRLHLISSLYY
ncbi:MAG: cytidylate kinase-like family protein [Proteobacteria bacterium]|nr:cytidylate kinase-like family protein [Pseudomonadota bacterium]